MSKDMINQMIVEPVYEDTPHAILLSSNNDFVKYAAVLIQSIIDKSKEDNVYDIVVFHVDIEAGTMQKLNKMIENHDNFHIRFVDVADIANQYTLYTERETMVMTNEAYFRLLAPDMFSEKYKKIIYLDCDMVLQTDIAELYHIDLGDHYLAAARDITGIATCSRPNSPLLEYRKDVLGLSEANDYFISGLLVMNLAKLKEDYPEYSLMKLAASREWRQHDQDVLNFVCNGGKHSILHASWNLLQDYGSNKYLAKDLKKEWFEAVENPKIIHYGGPLKPFKRDVIRQEYFWRVAANTEFFSQIVCEMINEHLVYKINETEIDSLSEKLRIEIISETIKPTYSAIIKYILKSSVFDNDSIESKNNYTILELQQKYSWQCYSSEKKSLKLWQLEEKNKKSEKKLKKIKNSKSYKLAKMLAAISGGFKK